MTKAKTPPKSSPKPTASVSVRISEEVRYRADLYATKNRRSLKAIVDEALDEYLRKRNA